ncbi:hypothetical protein DE146DRAFT_672478 [Phaeosphaeria sp. MPI-PUGE-AT-0046c]|nr:hypothetical protein DE146DRAFT_672478 [Phaeosphaeria sp. MPI-PUGE-AT-0046c]
MAPDKPFVILELMIACAHSAIFIPAWNLHLPTDLERLVCWVCIAGTMGIEVFGGVFEVMDILIEFHWRRPFLFDSD